MKPDGHPRVSVLMPMRNAGVYLRAAIDSVLSQSQESLELIVVDDGSTDGSGDVVRGIGDPRVRVLEGPRRGIAAGLNLALSEARGEVVMRCDADDLYPPDRIRRQLDWLAAHPQHAAVCGPFSTIDRRGDTVSALGPWPAEAVLEASSWILAHRLSTSLCTFAIRREAMQRLGGFRSFFETAEDIDFVLRLAEKHSVGFIPDNAYLYRLHDSSVTHIQQTSLREYFARTAHAMSLDRRARGTDALMRGEPPDTINSVDESSLPAQSASSHIRELLIGEAWHLLKTGDKIGARSSAWRAVQVDKLHWDAWKAALLIWYRSAAWT